MKQGRYYINMLFIIFSFLFAFQVVGSAFEKRIMNGETIATPDFGCTLCKSLIWFIGFFIQCVFPIFR